MTISDIENTLVILKKLHPNLNEEMLNTLLRASGWEEKYIKDAVLVFRSKGGVLVSPLEKLFIPNEEEKVLPSEIDTTHELLEHNPNDNLVEINNQISFNKETSTESFIPPTTTENINNLKKESLIEPVVSNTINRQKSEIPENLPLLPFEGSSHVWTFSKYKDTFNDDAVSDINNEKKEVEGSPNHHVVLIPLSEKDEKMLLMAYISLFIILLLLGYMYANGRL
jgi:hypothetical protein